jgi:hypothetical protein
MKLYPTPLGYLWFEAAGSSPQQTEREPPDKSVVSSVMIDFPSLSAFLASVSIIPPRESTRGLNVRPEGGRRRRCSLATALRCF